METIGTMGTVGTMGTIGIMGTIANGKKLMKMGYRNFKTQEIWLFEENIMGVEKKKFGSLISLLTFGSLMSFDGNEEK